MQTTSLWRNIIRFVFLVLLQGIALEHISLPGNLHWILYPLFVVLLPLQTPAVAVLLASFAAGFCVAELKEALPLVKFGKPVQILGAVLDYEIPAVVANHIILGITDVEVAK